MKEESLLFFNGEILTMEEEKEYPEAVYIEEGKIKKIGELKKIKKWVKPETKEIDLKGKTLMPSFIDSHSHITALAKTLAFVSLTECKSIAEIIEKMKQEKEKRPKGKWMIGVGYDHNFLEEKRHPNKFDLDQISKEDPILISHISGHMGVTNSIGLLEMKIDKDTKAPEGGNYGRIERTLEPDGYLEENAFIFNSKQAGEVLTEEYAQLILQAQEVYLKNGITTVQDGLTKKEDWEALKQASEKEGFKVDIISYLDILENSSFKKAEEKYDSYHKRLKIGGYKMILDGSPQGRTAWMSKPYEGEKEYRGYPARTTEEVNRFVKMVMQEKKQLLTHCNGDAAADQLINALEQYPKQQVNELRPVMIHAQTIRKDQIRKCKKLGIIPSYFIAHTYYWGDIHIQNLGKRAEWISPAKTSREEKLKFTFHQDTPVLPPNMLETVWCAVNRKTKQGSILGKEEKIEIYQALQAVTIHAAYQYFEEQRKGSIQEGKLADLIILDRNPLKVPKEEIKTIKILKTMKEGKIVGDYQ